MFSIYVYNVTK